MLLGRAFREVVLIHSLSLVAQTDFVPFWYGVAPAARALGSPEFSRVDWIELFKFTGLTTPFLIAISWGRTQHPCSSAATLAPLVIGVDRPYVVRGAVLVRTSSQLELSRSCSLNSPQHSVLFLIVKDYSTTNASAALLPNRLGFAISGIVTGRLVTRFNNFRWAICIGAALHTIWRVNDSRPVWLTSLLICGICHGAILTAQNFATQAMCKLGDEGAAAAILLTKIANNVDTYLPTLHSLPRGPAKDAIYDAYKFGFRIAFATWLGLSVLILFLCLVFIKHADMNRKLMSEHHLDSERAERHWGRKDLGGEPAI
ncbi:MFS general substrate transporter [Xylaria acuta]|nr:MFS general substrate transporter [Xylaria acuta]